MDTCNELELKCKLESMFSSGPFSVLVAAPIQMYNTKNCSTELSYFNYCGFLLTTREDKESYSKQICIHHLELTNVSILLATLSFKGTSLLGRGAERKCL